MRRSAALVFLLGAAAACGKGPPPPMTVMAPKSDFAAGIYRLFLAITGVDIFILSLVTVLVVLGIFVFSKRAGIGTEFSHRRQIQLETAWTIGPALILATIGTLSVRMTFRTQPPVAPPGSLVVHVIAHQWWWEVQYPGLDVTTANEIHLPLNRPVRIQLDSADVIHSFWVPMLGGKRDVVPGQTNEITLVGNVPGRYRGQCAEFCGTSHANMRFEVVVEPPGEFQGWITHQQTPPVTPGGPGASDPAVVVGARLYAQSSCTPCHTIGRISTGVFGPNLTHFASRAMFAGGTLPNTPENLAGWLRDPQALKPGAKMPQLGLPPPQIADLVAYLETLK